MLTKMDLALCFFPLSSMNLLWYAEKYILHVITGDVGLASQIPRIESRSLYIVAADNTSFCSNLLFTMKNTRPNTRENNEGMELERSE